jgi:hypothetical protein
MRLSRVLECGGGGHCPGGVYPRSNAPFGEILHWPFLQDWILLGLAAPLRFFMESRDAVTTAGYALGPLLGLASLAFLMATGRRLITSSGFYFLGLLFAGQFWVPYAFAPHRPDHHGLQAMLYLVAMFGAVGLLLEPRRRGPAWITGISAGVALWVSTEALISMAPILGLLGLYWVFRGGDDLARANRDLYLGSVLVILVGLPLDGPVPDRLAAEFDRFSVVHLCLLVLLVAFWTLAGRIQQRPRRTLRLADPMGRLSWGVLGGLAIAGAMMVAFPGVERGPMAGVHPALFPLWLDQVAEFVPVVGGQNGFWAGVTVSPLVVALPVSLWLSVRGNVGERWAWRLIGLACAWFGGLILFQQVRWAHYLHLIVPFPLAWLLGRLVHSTDQPGLRLRRAVVNVTVVTLFLTAPILVMVLFSGGTGQRGASEARCGAPPMIPVLSELPAMDERGGVILAPVFWGPEILWWTPHRVVSTPYHRNAEGMLDSYRIMAAADAGAAKRIVERRGVRWVAMCRGQSWTPGVPLNQEGTLYDSLQKESPPPWLRPVPLPDSLANTHLLFEVVSESGPYPL